MANNILVTGGGGYLGSIVIDALRHRKSHAKENPVKIVSSDIRDIPAAKRHKEVVYFQEDIRSPGLIELLRQQAITTVVHLAAVVTPGKKSHRQLEYEIDVLGSENVLKACVGAGVKKIIVSSSGAAYGYHPDNPAWITEDDPLRGNETFAYAWHKRLVEELLAEYRHTHPQLQQVIFRIGTILGETTRNQITALFEKPVVLAIRGSDSPFVFIWDHDVANCIVEAIFSEKTGIYNLAGDGAVTIDEIAKILGKSVIAIPPGILKAALFLFKKLGISQYGPEQLDFLRYRPVLDNRRLKEEFGYIPQKTSKEVFEFFVNSKKVIG
jgi:UDP-glucose 4-epimerase